MTSATAAQTPFRMRKGRLASAQAYQKSKAAPKRLRRLYQRLSFLEDERPQDERHADDADHGVHSTMLAATMLKRRMTMNASAT